MAFSSRCDLIRLKQADVGFDLRVTRFQVPADQRGETGVRFVAQPEYPLFVGVELIHGVFLTGIGDQQDHEHQRDGKSEDIDRRIELVAAQKVEKCPEIEDGFHGLG